MPSFLGRTVNPSAYGISPMADGGNRRSSFGFLETVSKEEVSEYSTLNPDFSRRNAIVADVESRALRHPAGNRNRNG